MSSSILVINYSLVATLGMYCLFHLFFMIKVHSCDIIDLMRSLKFYPLSFMLKILIKISKLGFGSKTVIVIVLYKHNLGYSEHRCLMWESKGRLHRTNGSLIYMQTFVLMCIFASFPTQLHNPQGLNMSGMAT